MILFGRGTEVSEGGALRGGEVEQRAKNQTTKIKPIVEGSFFAIGSFSMPNQFRSILVFYVEDSF